MAVADSSFLVALFLKYDINHENAKKIYSEILKQGELIFIPYEILIETLTVLLYKEGIDFVKEVYDFLENSNFVFINKITNCINLFLKQENKLSYFDFVPVELALKLNTKLLTFDKKQEELLRKLKRT